MHIETIYLVGTTPGTQHQLCIHHFGTPGRGPKATIQAALHADEVPAILVAHALCERLLVLEAAGELIGEVQVLPMANPLGLAQEVNGQHQGRFDLRDGINFNRGYADLTDTVAAAVQGRLGPNAAANVQAIRAALRDAAAALPASNAAQDLKRRLLQTAIDSDIVLDLHCDGEAVLHLYAMTAQQSLATELGTLLGARAILLAEESGDSPFDEACSRPWLLLQRRFAGHPIPPACFSTTVELRGEADASHELAGLDADAIVEFLRRRGIVAGVPAALPAACCEATPLSCSEPITSPAGRVVVFRVQAGQLVQAGDVIADLVCPETGVVESLRATSAGVVYARIATRWAAAGKHLAKIAGKTHPRSGKLLSP